MSRIGVVVRVSKEHAALLKDLQRRYGYPTISSASAFLMKQVKEKGVFEEKKEEAPKKKFDFHI